jgi:hypothetical protein
MRLPLLLLVGWVLAAPLLAQSAAVAKDPAAAAAELAELTSLLHDAAGADGLPFAERNPCIEVSTRLALFPMRFGLLPRDTEGYAKLQWLAASLVERLDKNLTALAEPQPPSRPKLSWWWMQHGIVGLPWRFVYGMLLDLAGRVDEARSIAFAPDMHTGGCLGRPYSFVDLCGFEAQLRADLLMRQGESVSAAADALAAMLSDFGADYDLLAVEAGWLQELRGAPDDACLLYDWAIQGSGVRDAETLGSQLARSALARLGREHQPVWLERMELWFSSPDDQDHFRGEQAVCIARAGDADSWRLLAVRVPVRLDVADTDEVKMVTRADDLSRARPYLEWLAARKTSRHEWVGLFLLHALDRTGRARLNDAFQSLCPAPGTDRLDSYSLNEIDHFSRAIVGRGPEIGKALPVPNSPGYRNIGLSCEDFAKAWLDELAKPR